MVKLVSIVIYRHGDEEKNQKPVRLAYVADLSAFSFWSRSTIGEHVRYLTRAICMDTKIGNRQSVSVKDIPYVIHSYVRTDGLSGCVVTDSEYPQRIAFALLQKTLQSYEESNEFTSSKWKEIVTDSTSEPQFLRDNLEAYQDPSADKLYKIQKELEELKDIMNDNINKVLERGESLEVLMARSEDLNANALKFYEKVPKSGCCKVY